MESKLGESTTAQSRTPPRSTTEANNDDAGNFECNICLDMAHEPVIALCGHLFCWPCLYKWLHIYSHCQDCPVCKTPIQDQNLVPLYGHRDDSGSESAPSIDIPCRPAGQRPITDPFVDRNYFGPGPGLGARSWVSARYGNYTFAAAFGSVIPWLNWDREA